MPSCESVNRRFSELRLVGSCPGVLRIDNLRLRLTTPFVRRRGFVGSLGSYSGSQLCPVSERVQHLLRSIQKAYAADGRRASTLTPQPSFLQKQPPGPGSLALSDANPGRSKPSSSRRWAPPERSTNLGLESGGSLIRCCSARFPVIQGSQRCWYGADLSHVYTGKRWVLACGSAELLIIAHLVSCNEMLHALET